MIVRRLPIHRLQPADYNPRQDLKPDDPRYAALAKSLDEFGLVQPLVYNERTGTLVGGHQRLKVLLARGETHVDAVVVALSPEKEKALNLALNKISGGWDRDKLAGLLDELVKTPELDVGLTGFEMPEVEQLLAGLLKGAEGQEGFDVEAALQDDTPVVTKPGDLLQLGLHGEHRLLCGDSKNPRHVAKLLGDQRARLLHADPPYGVRYDPRNRPGVKKGKTAVPHPRTGRIRNDDLTPKRYATWFGKIADQFAEALAPGAPFYIWNGHRNFGLMHDLLRARGFHVASVLTWAKQSPAPGFGDYSDQTEFCLYGWKGGARHCWHGPNSETTLWDVRRDRTDRYQHPTQKALELAERAIRNSSRQGELVFDPFLGSGTTLIAAARLGRRCFGMEIEPRYCDVIIRRYIALAGKGAVPSDIAKRYLAREVAR